MSAGMTSNRGRNPFCQRHHQSSIIRISLSFIISIITIIVIFTIVVISIIAIILIDIIITIQVAQTWL